MVTGTKLGSYFPSAQFHIHGYAIRYRLGKNGNGGGVLLYVREDISSKKKDNAEFDTGLEAIFIEINVRRTKWLITCSQNPHKVDIKNQLKVVT